MKGGCPGLCSGSSYRSQRPTRAPRLMTDRLIDARWLEHRANRRNDSTDALVCEGWGGTESAVSQKTKINGSSGTFGTLLYTLGFS